MRNLLLAASASALALAAWSGPGRSSAQTVVYGGLAGECSKVAKAGRFDQAAMDLCTGALAQDVLNRHDRAGTYVNRGAMELRVKATDAAHQDFTAALQLMPSMGEAHIGEGAYLISMERWPEAEAEITRGLDLGSEEPEKGYYFRGIARWGQDNFKGAYLDLHKASELKPDWALPRQQLANFHVQPAP